MCLAPFTNSEILDILVVVSQALCRSIREVTKEMRLEIRDLPKKDTSEEKDHFRNIQIV